jgi:hypothetical protein
MIQHKEQGFPVNLAMDGNDSDSHSLRASTETNRITTPLGFNYDSRISESISDMLEACDLVNIHNLQHREAPPTHKQGSRQIDFMFISRRLVEHVEACGILPLTLSLQVTIDLSSWISMCSYFSAIQFLALKEQPYETYN